MFVEIANQGVKYAFQEYHFRILREKSAQVQPSPQGFSFILTVFRKIDCFLTTPNYGPPESPAQKNFDGRQSNPYFSSWTDASIFGRILPVWF